MPSLTQLRHSGPSCPAWQYAPRRMQLPSVEPSSQPPRRSVASARPQLPPTHGPSSGRSGSSSARFPLAAAPVRVRVRVRANPSPSPSPNPNPSPNPSLGPKAYRRPPRLLWAYPPSIRARREFDWLAASSPAVQAGSPRSYTRCRWPTLVRVRVRVRVKVRARVRLTLTLTLTP